MAASESFEVASRRSAQTHHLVAEGELDIATVPALEGPFDAAAASDAESILVDLAGITFVDSTGLRLLIRMTEKCDGGRLRIRTSATVDRLLEITGLLDQLPLVREEQAPGADAP